MFNGFGNAHEVVRDDKLLGTSYFMVLHSYCFMVLMISRTQNEGFKSFLFLLTSQW